MTPHDVALTYPERRFIPIYSQNGTEMAIRATWKWCINELFEHEGARISYLRQEIGEFCPIKHLSKHRGDA